MFCFVETAVDFLDPKKEPRVGGRFRHRPGRDRGPLCPGRRRNLGVAGFLKLRSSDPGGSERPAQEPIAPLTGLLIVLDPGHGGDDRGVCHFESDLIEKEINLDLALRLQEQLEKAGARVLLTRADDTFVSLDERARIANDAEAHLF